LNGVIGDLLQRKASGALSLCSTTVSGRSGLPPLPATTSSCRLTFRIEKRSRIPDNPAVIVIARSTQEAIVVNLPALYSLSDEPE
jgi:hypothetical protein